MALLYKHPQLARIFIVVDLDTIRDKESYSDCGMDLGCLTLGAWHPLSAPISGDGANYKSSAPAGQAGKGHCRWQLQVKPARGLCIAVL